MSTLRVTAEPLTIHVHPNADALELAQVGLYRAVVAKGAFRSGDHAIYIPEQSVLPAGLIEELGLTGRLAGAGKDRVRAIRLRGELSQGIVCRPKALDGVDLAAAHAAGEDFAELLGVVKWVPPVPVSMSGDVFSAADLLPWTDIENIARYPGIFEPGEPVSATEKVHGTCCLLTYLAETGESLVSSKGFGSKYLALVETDRNLYWRTMRAHRVPEAAAKIAEAYGARRVGVYGEVYGKGVQDLAYGANAGEVPGFAAFDVCLDVDGVVRWLGAPQWSEALADTGVGIPPVPVLYEGPYDEALLLALASGQETVSGTGAHLREGIVVRSQREHGNDVVGSRTIGKIVSVEYVTRSGGTEYE
ncbi:RNA ligase (ATP) [Catenulispora pinisilvae]|uniref:RNA ligase (ATP) n=1 Tax=Catenulispora pinisilvae TaxID=2705253 RepID=UPI001890D9BD|nr:RNA ligase (ATP) [Catenulispora pinisilvae]